MSTWFRTYGFTEVRPDLLVGAYPLDQRDVALLASMGVKRVLNLAEDSEYREGEREAAERALEAAGIEEYRISMIDFGSLSESALEEAIDLVDQWLTDGVRTYLHCRAGWQRSAAVAAGLVAVRDGVDIDSALDYVQRRKPSADPLPHQRDDLRRWWEGRANQSGASN
ncbi:MAG: dual specificity protein phosphatase family protein [Actinomycetota bacterium]|nr:dual specificity protein phosphatase family protein [Actinomycetota bacterium]